MHHRQAEATIAATARCSIARDFPLLCLAAEAALYSGEHGGNRWRADGLADGGLGLVRFKLPR